ncbi:hypothetical protein JKP88DRAFT_229445 [Tribonema minus]|uniref:Uncharacterized protein n=1 Tax=Tribonema minus TaxID=303371 RepID=A0A835YGN4_9STRA|nr:hypothetical protein JKP88DRAFT_229445 [Tribonema minus]
MRAGIIIAALLAQALGVAAFFGAALTAPSRHLRAASALRMMTVSIDLKGKERLQKYLKDCELLGPVRFVSMNDGAILEAVGSFENLRFNDLEKGTYATLSGDDEGFECHLNIDRVNGITMLTKPAKDASHDLYITRFVDAEGKTVLSAMLQAEGGQYEEGAVAYWTKLREAFGAEQKLQ